MMRYMLSLALAAAMGFAGINGAQASLIGDTVAGDLDFDCCAFNGFDPTLAFNTVPAPNNVNQPNNVLVSDPDGALPSEFIYNDGFVAFDVDIDALTIDILETNANANPATGTPIGWEMEFTSLDTGTPGGILGVVVELGSLTFTGLQITGFTTDSITITWPGGSGLSTEEQDVVLADFNETGLFARITIEVSEVLLPAALPLYGTGLGLMGLFGWWRRRKAVAA